MITTRSPPDSAVEIAIQLTPTYEEEIDIVERFVLRTSGCQRAIEGNACSSQISRETFLAHRAQCAELYARYQQACAGAGIQAVGRSKFYDTWQSLLPHISVSTPSSDLCFVCQQNNLAIQKAVCLSDDEKSARIQVAQTHLDRAKTEREYYNVQIKEAKEQFNDSVKF